MPSYPPVRSVLRALDLLEELNLRRTTSLQDLHAGTGLPKPTLVRLLETLAFAGYVRGGKGLEGYQVTAQVAMLSVGLQGSPLIVEAARPVALALTRRVKWPAQVAVLEQTSAVVCLSTAPDTSMAPIQTPVGLRLSLVSRALGRAWLASCPDREREALLRMIAALPPGEDNPPNLQAVARRVVATVRRNGFAERDPGVDPRESNTVAVPIMQGERVMATFGLGYYRRAVPPEVLRGELLPALKEAAREIEGRLARLRDSMATKAVSTSEIVPELPRRRGARG